METALTSATALKDLSVGVVAILAVVYTWRMASMSLKEQQQTFLREIEKRDEIHRKETVEYNTAYRELEKEVRTTITKQLALSTHTLEKNTNAMEKIARHISDSHRTPTPV